MQQSFLLLLASTLAAAVPLRGSTAHVYRGDFLKGEVKQLTAASIKSEDPKQVYYNPPMLFYTPPMAKMGKSASIDEEQVYLIPGLSYFDKDQDVAIDKDQAYFMPGMSFFPSADNHARPVHSFGKDEVYTHAKPVGVYDYNPWGFL